MKRSIAFLFMLSLVFVISSCGQAASSVSPTEPFAVLDQAGLLSDLKAAGATPEIGDPITQDFFSAEGKLINLGDAETFQVFEYKTAKDMEADASKVAPDGGSVGTAMMNWMMPPHFFKSGRILVLYVGNNETTLGLLKKIMGDQFAGQ